MRARLGILVGLAVGLSMHAQEKGRQADNSGSGDTHAPSTSAKFIVCTIKQNGTTIECQYPETPKTPSKGYFIRLISAENLPNLLLVLVGLGAIGAAIQTLRQVERQANLMEEQNRTTRAKERARLSLHILGMKFGSLPMVTFNLTCHGTTPAFIKSSWVNTELLPIPDFEWPKGSFGMESKNLPEVMPPGTIECYANIFGDNPTRSDDDVFAAMKKRDLYLHFRVRIEYVDIFGDEQSVTVSKIYGLPEWNVLRPIGSSIPDWRNSTYEYGSA